ncbi:MAG TPA: sulfite exporter TauE/SafE family protein, partial [Povalibacter sp.]
MTPQELALAAMAAAAAGAVNALAGGGTLISFPALLAMGVPPVAANVTNAVALSPGYFGATLAQRGNLGGQRQRLSVLIPAAVIGGLAGGVILLHTHDRTFQALVPYMLFAASVLLALQNRIRAAVVRRLSHPGHITWGAASLSLPVALAGVYGGFFTAGMSVIVLAVLGTTLDDTFTRLNALKQVLAFSIN